MEKEDRNSLNSNDSSFLNEFDDPNYEDPKSGETDDESYYPSEDEDLAGLYYKQLAKHKKISDICFFVLHFSCFCS